MITRRTKNVLEETDLGMNGAAFAAFGDIDGAFLVSLGVRKEGVKLGESTLNVFFMLLPSCYITFMAPEEKC